jgi:hypothetical protein
MKAVLKLIVVVLMANALWSVGSAYASLYKFKDSVYAAAMEEGKSVDDLREKILELASTYDLPLTAETLTIRREVHRTTVEGSFTKPVAVLPGYEYAWPFTVDIDAYVIVPPVKLKDLASP